MWTRFWFSEKHRYNPLGLLRIVATSIWATELPSYLRYMGLCNDLPDGYVADLLGLRMMGNAAFPLPEALQQPFGLILYGALVLAFVGLFTRISLAVTALGAFYLFAGEVASDGYDHQLLLTVYVLPVLAVAPGSRQLSLDAILKWWRGGKRTSFREAVLSFSTGKTWGYKLILCMFASLYVAAGVSKLRYSDGRWVDGKTLSYYMANEERQQVYFGQRDTFSPDLRAQPIELVDQAYGAGSSKPARWMARFGPLMALLATATIVLELAAPLLLGGPAVRLGYLASVFMMHTSIGLLMHLGFTQYRLYLLSLVDWRWLSSVLRAWIERRRPPG